MERLKNVCRHMRYVADTIQTIGPFGCGYSEKNGLLIEVEDHDGVKTVGRSDPFKKPHDEAKHGSIVEWYEQGQVVEKFYPQGVIYDEKGRAIIHDHSGRSSVGPIEYSYGVPTFPRKSAFRKIVEGLKKVFS